MNSRSSRERPRAYGRKCRKHRTNQALFCQSLADSTCGSEPHISLGTTFPRRLSSQDSHRPRYRRAIFCRKEYTFACLCCAARSSNYPKATTLVIATVVVSTPDFQHIPGGSTRRRKEKPFIETTPRKRLSVELVKKFSMPTEAKRHTQPTEVSVRACAVVETKYLAIDRQEN